MGKGASPMNSQHAFADRGADLYQTPSVAVRALLRVETLPKRVWEPACGPGAIVRVLRRQGYDVVATDLHDYDCEGQLDGVDFLQAPFVVDESIGAIVTNPPFMYANEFVIRALQLVPRVYMLLKLNFLEGEKRRPVLDVPAFAKCYVFRNRLPMMHREGWEGPKASSAIPYAWYVWNRDHTGPATIERISWYNTGGDE